jgi:GNAT superfamily N-acetyltransferase
MVREITHPTGDRQRRVWGAMAFQVAALTTETWADFAGLVERHNGVWGGCWCMGFHAKGPGWGVSADLNRAEKQGLVAAGRAQAALVYDAAECVGWAQFGLVAELPRIKNAKAYAAGLVALPDWRVTCFFVDKAHRGQGVAFAALQGALDLIAAAGGGVVEGYPEEVEGRGTSAFLHSATLAMFERAGFARERKIGKAKWVVRRGGGPV